MNGAINVSMFPLLASVAPGAALPLASPMAETGSASDNLNAATPCDGISNAVQSPMATPRSLWRIMSRTLTRVVGANPTEPKLTTIVDALLTPLL